jgi:hypothetical protein
LKKAVIAGLVPATHEHPDSIVLRDGRAAMTIGIAKTLE